MTILLDREPVAKLRIDESATVNVECGTHILRAKMDWVSSPELTIRVSDESSPVVEVGANFIQTFLASFFINRKAGFTISLGE